jgi:hypothetical protein
MKTRSGKLALSCFFFLFAVLPVFGGGVVTSATESNFRAALAGGGTVTFAVDGTITFGSTIVITNDTILDGAGQQVTLSGGGAVRVMTANPGVNLTLRNLTIADGNDSTIDSCGGLNSQANSLTITRCTFSNNVGVISSAIRQWNGGLLTVTDSTFVHNRGIAGAIDTGLVSFTYGVRLTNCTFYGNSGDIGAVLVREPISVPSWMVNCTVAGNTNLSSAAVVETASFIPTTGRLTLVNTIVAHSVGGENGSGFVDGGYNLSSDSSSVFGHATSLKNTDPVLGGLADNGGPTWTMALQANSPALNSANAAAAPTADQRGVSRPQGTATDRGAFESGDLAATTTIGFKLQGFSALESDSVLLLDVIRYGTATGTTTADFTTADASAVAGVDYTASYGTIQFTNGQTNVSLAIPIANNLQRQTNRAFSVSLTNVSAGAGFATYTNVPATIVDDDSELYFTATNYLVKETHNLLGVVVVREGYLSNTVSADFSIADGTATRGLDYDVAATNGMLSFAPGISSRTLWLTNLDDLIIEADETIIVALSNPQGQVTLGAPATSMVTIFDNEQTYVVTNLTEQELRTAIASERPVVFAVDGTITLANTLVITNDTILDGAGQQVTLSGGGAVRVMTANPGVSLTLRNLTIADGYDAGSPSCGGVSSRAASLTVTRCTFSNNVAVVAPDGNGALRQWEGGLLTVTDSTFIGNRGSGSAGAIDTGFASFTYGVRLTNCTFYANSGAAGAVLVREPISVPSWMVNCTVAGNTNLFDAAVKETSNPFPPTTGRLTLVNTIVAHSVGGENGSGFVDGGYNLSSDSSSVFSHGTSLKNTDPLLGGLADNGGPTWTMALQANSPALNSADVAAAPATDQRGLLRPYGAGDDIGAYEWADPFVIQGNVSGVTLTNEVAITINGVTLNTTNGWFVQFSNAAGSYTITPLDENYVFVPTNRTVSLGPDQLDVNFTAYRRNTLSLDSLALGMVNLGYAGTNAQLIRILMSTDGNTWIPIATNSIGADNVLLFSSPAENSIQLYRTELLQ